MKKLEETKTSAQMQAVLQYHQINGYRITVDRSFQGSKQLLVSAFRPCQNMRNNWAHTKLGPKINDKVDMLKTTSQMDRADRAVSRI